jgi:hypothetical protein
VFYLERVIGVVAGLALLFGVRSAYNKVLTEAMKPQPVPEFASITPIVVGTIGPVLIPTPNIPRGIVSGR